MDEFPARVKPYPAVLQPQCGMAKFAKLDPGNVEVERLPLNMQAVLRDSPAPLHKQCIVLWRPIAGDHMDLACAGHRFMHKIDMLQQLHIDGSNFSCVMATQNVIHLVQSRQIIVPSLVTKANPQSFVRVDVEKDKFSLRKFVRAHD